MARTTESQIAEAWAASDNGSSFISALAERGFTLAQGNKRLVVVDSDGKIYNPVRHIEGVQTKQLRERLKGIELSSLPDAEALAQQRAAGHAAKPVPKEESAAADLTAAFNAHAADHTEPAPQQSPEAPAPTPEAKPATEDFNQTSSATPETQTEERDARPDAHPPVNHAALRMQERHQRERAELNQLHSERIEREKRDMSAYYRLEELGTEIETLRNRCSKKSFWRWILGAYRRDRKQLAKLEENYKDSRKRYDERIDAFEHQHNRRLEMLYNSQERERQTLLRLQAQNTRDMGREASHEREALQNSPDAGVKHRGFGHDR